MAFWRDLNPDNTIDCAQEIIVLSLEDMFTEASMD